MNTEIVAETARATLSGSMPFPEVVRRLLATGVTYYHGDYVALRKTFYSATGDVGTTPIPDEGVPPVAADFDAAGLRAAMLDSPRHGQHDRDCTRCAMEARASWSSTARPRRLSASPSRRPCRCRRTR